MTGAGHRYEVKGKNVRKWRLIKGFTRERLSEASGVSARAIARIEDGQAKATITVLAGVSRALNVPISEFVNVHEGLKIAPEQLKRFLEEAHQSDDDMNYGLALQRIEDVIALSLHYSEIRNEARLWQAIYLDHSGQQERALELLDCYVRDVETSCQVVMWMEYQRAVIRISLYETILVSPHREPSHVARTLVSEAQQILLRIRNGAGKSLGRDAIVSIEHHIGVTWLLLGRFDEATQILRDCLSRRPTSGPHTFRRVYDFRRLAQALFLSKSDSKRAEQELNRAYLAAKKSKMKRLTTMIERDLRLYSRI